MRDVKKILEKNNKIVYTPTLTGMGERVHLINSAIDHHTYVKDILNIIKYESLDNIVLLGHSYAGLVVTCVASEIPHKISKLIYLDAFIPENNKSHLDTKPKEVQEIFIKIAKEQGEDWKIPPSISFLKKWGIEDDEQCKTLLKKMTPITLASLQKPVIFNENKLKSIPTTYISCSAAKTQDDIDPFIDVARNKGWKHLTIKASHLAMITHPKLLAGTILYQ